VVSSTHPSFEPRSSTLPKNFSLLYLNRHDNLIPVIFNTILQVGNLLPCPPNTPLLFFRVKFSSLKKEGSQFIGGPVSFNSGLLVSETPKDALFEKEFTKSP